MKRGRQDAKKGLIPLQHFSFTRPPSPCLVHHRRESKSCPHQGLSLSKAQLYRAFLQSQGRCFPTLSPSCAGFSQASLPRTPLPCRKKKKKKAVTGTPIWELACWQSPCAAAGQVFPALSSRFQCSHAQTAEQLRSPSDGVLPALQLPQEHLG